MTTDKSSLPVLPLTATAPAGVFLPTFVASSLFNFSFLLRAFREPIEIHSSPWGMAAYRATDGTRKKNAYQPHPPVTLFANLFMLFRDRRCD